MGCSLLELLIDFELTTGKTVRRAENLLTDGAALLRREGSLTDTVQLFQAEALAQVRDRLTQDARAFFKPCKGRVSLASLGTRTSTTCFQAWPVQGRGRHADVPSVILAQRGVDKEKARNGLPKALCWFCEGASTCSDPRPGPRGTSPRGPCPSERKRQTAPPPITFRYNAASAAARTSWLSGPRSKKAHQECTASIAAAWCACAVADASRATTS